MGLVIIAAITLMVASGGTAIGWIMEVTTEAIENYKKTSVAKVPTAHATTSTLVILPAARDALLRVQKDDQSTSRPGSESEPSA